MTEVKPKRKYNVVYKPRKNYHHYKKKETPGWLLEKQKRIKEGLNKIL